MLNYKNILLAVDLSKASDYIMSRSASLAKNTHADLNVVHVVEHSPMAYGGEFSIPMDINLEKNLQEKARKDLAKFSQKYQIPEANQYIASGSVKLGVIDLAEEMGADLIIVGTHGHQGIDVLLGSRANAILHHAKCDVWVVRIE